ncbi:MAG: lipoprotein [Proteobacteria bacterium]|nr:lipoprotein [Pseudomonadota bacterium]
MKKLRPLFILLIVFVVSGCTPMPKISIAPENTLLKHLYF